MTSEEDYYSSGMSDGIHPPNVVLVAASSTPTSPGQNNNDIHRPDTSHHLHDQTCSPLSTAPNSPYRGVSYEDDDDDDDEDELVRLEEVQELLNTPASNRHRHLSSQVKEKQTQPPLRFMGEVPFDEGHAAGSKDHRPATTDTTDELMGNPANHPKQTTAAATTSVAVVTPLSDATSPRRVIMVEEDIDAYVPEEETVTDPAEDREEKKVDTHTPDLSPHPAYTTNHGSHNNNGDNTRVASAGFLSHYKLKYNANNNGHSHQAYANNTNGIEVLALDDDDDDDEEPMPHDERHSSMELEDPPVVPVPPALSRVSRQQQQQEKHQLPNDDFVESSRNLDVGDTNYNHDNKKMTNNLERTPEKARRPVKEALQTAERELEEMERRVQQMLEKRGLSSAPENNTGIKSAVSHDAPSDCEDQPPSLSPASHSNLNSATKTAANTSVGSGCSSFYYDGSVMGSAYAGSNNTSSDMIKTMKMADDDDQVDHLSGDMEHTYASSSNINGPSTEPGASPWKTNDYASSLHSSREEEPAFAFHSNTMRSSNNTYNQNVSSDISGFGKVASTIPATTAYEEFTASFDREASGGMFANAITDTSRAFNQVTEEVANFFGGTPSRSGPGKASLPSTQQSQKYPPISPSLDSDSTPQFENLSPRPNKGFNRASNAAAGTSILPGNAATSTDSDLMYSQGTSAILAKARSLVSERQSRLSPNTGVYEDASNKQRARRVIQNRSSNGGSGPASAVKADNPTLDGGNNAARGPGSDVSLPIPPTLHRLAAMMEGLGGSADNTDSIKKRNADVSTSNTNATDWPSSVSQLMEEYQNAITESLRNLSMEEVAGLAQQEDGRSGQEGLSTDTKISPAITLSQGDRQSMESMISNNAKKDASADDNTDGYGDMVPDLGFGACLQMPQLDHPPLVATRNSSTAQGNGKGKDYQQGQAGVLQYDAALDFRYHDEPDDCDGQVNFFGCDPDHKERADFANQLSARLLNLGNNTSLDTNASFEDKDSQEKQQGTVRRQDDQNLSFESQADMRMSPPKRGNPSMARTEGGGGIFACGMSQTKCLPTSDQPSVCSDGFSNSNVISPNRPHAHAESLGRPPHAAPSSIAKGLPPVDKPTMVESIDNETGIAKGDVMLSLLCDNSFQASKQKPDSWAWRVREAIWRCRDMRGYVFEPAGSCNGPDSDGNAGEMKRTPSLPVDVDDVRVVGGIQNVGSIQEKALSHLKQNEFEQALELYEDIIFNYYSFFEQVLAKRESEDMAVELSNFKPYIGASLHNLGVIHLMKGDYDDAFSFFKRAVDNRRACLGDSHPDCIVSCLPLCVISMNGPGTDFKSSLKLSLLFRRPWSDCRLADLQWITLPTLIPT